MGIGKKLHPNKAKRHEERAAAARLAAAQVAAENARIAIANNKLAKIQQLEMEFNATMSSVDIWQNNELQQATVIYDDKKQDFSAAAQHFSDEYKFNLEQLNAAYAAEIAQQVALKKAEIKTAVNNLHDDLKNNLSSNNAELFSAYLRLVDRNTEHGSKIALYSKLVAWLHDLSLHDKLTAEQYANYLQFIQAANFKGVDLTTLAAKSLHAKIQELLIATTHEQTGVLQACYQSDEQYMQQLQTSAAEVALVQTVKQKHELELAENLRQALQVLQQEEEKLEVEYQQYKMEVISHAYNLRQGIAQQRDQLAVEIDTQHVYQLNLITAKLARELEVIKYNLAQAIKKIVAKSKGMVINLVATVAGMAGAYFAPALLAGTSASVAASVQGSCLATGIGSLANLMRDKEDKIGLSINFAFVPNSTLNNFVATNKDNHIVNREPFNLVKFKEQYAEKTQQILALRTKIEHKLRYNLTNAVTLSKAERSEYKFSNAKFANNYKSVSRILTYQDHKIQAIGKQQANGDYQVLFRSHVRPEVNYLLTISQADFVLGKYKGKVIAAINAGAQYMGQRTRLRVVGSALSVTAVVADVMLPGSVEDLAINALLYATGSKGAQLAMQAIHRVAAMRKIGRSLAADPFKGQTFSKIDRRLRLEGFKVVGKDPANSKGAYFHPTSGRKYFLDKADKRVYKEGLEKPHVDVHRKNVQTGESVEKMSNLPSGTKLITEKRKYPLGDQLVDSTIKPTTQLPKVKF